MKAYGALVIVCSVAIIVLMINLVVMNVRREYPIMKWLCMVLFAFSMTRYLTLIVYGDSPSLSQMEVLRYFYFATAIGLTIPFASAVWYITPHLREKVVYLKYLLFFVPWVAFYLYVIIAQPTAIVMGKNYGYDLVLTGKFPLYLGIVQGSFVAVMFILCVSGYLKYKHSQLRSQYILLIIALIALLIDGVSFYIPVRNVVPAFTVSEVFGFVAILYAYAKKPLRIRGDK